jgi:glycosyltransferase involved in cell wall biosynthesis
MLRRIDAWVVTAAKNRKVFEVYGEPARCVSIRNGVDAGQPGEPLSRSALGLRKKSTVLLLASRAIPAKGWFHAVEMTQRLNEAGHATDLMLIGDGPAADEIAARRPPNVHLYGHVANLASYIAAADIGLLPSYFIGESMPLVLLDMMAQGKPVIATNVGEIPDMIGLGPDAGGFVVPLLDGEPDVASFVKAIQALKPAKTRAAMGERARARYERDYRIDAMVDTYRDLYLDLFRSRYPALRHRAA